MMIAVFSTLALLWQFYLGYSRGLVKQIYLLVSFLLSFFLAYRYFQVLAIRLTLWVPYTQAVQEQSLPFFQHINIFDMDKVFYEGIAFILILLGSYAVLKTLGIFLHFLPLYRLDSPLFNLISGGISVLLTLIFWSFLFNLMATIPFDQVQNLLKNSPLLTFFIKFPLVYQLTHLLWTP